MTQRKRFRRVVEWGVPHVNNYERRINDLDLLCMGVLLMIPILGQIIWFYWLVQALNDRKVYYEEIKD